MFSLTTRQAKNSTHILGDFWVSFEDNTSMGYEQGLKVGIFLSVLYFCLGGGKLSYDILFLPITIKYVDMRVS